MNFGPYRVVRKLGQGGMGAVFLGEHTLIGRRAAIKVLHRERSTQRESVERFFTEARATSAMEDPGIVQVYDFGVTTDGTAYLIMEFLDGEPLSARLRNRGALHPSDAVRITRQIAGSLAAAHAMGIVHRDLKPENLFMVRDKEALGGERPKILDFGIAKLGDEELTQRFQTRTGAVMGTPAYMSPEQCNDSGRIDHRTDVYSLGCVMFHLLTGRPPFDLEGVGAIIAAHLREPAPVPSRVAPRVPELLDPIVARCLAKNPDDRYSSMTELQEACEAAFAQLPAAPPISSSEGVALREVREDAITTLGTSAGESLTDARPIPLRLWIGIATIAIAAGIVLAVTTHGGSSEKVVPAVQPRVEIEPTPPPVVAPPAPIVPQTVPVETGASGSVQGSDVEVGEPATTAVPSKTPVKRPGRKTKKGHTNAETYEDRF
ncbi:MAG TPA: serine/threonine-protein kinase [Kofleriaceae bacterium]|nr:serine/threonine-protein kinase [Kofleriaceae bacterium]